MFCALYCSARKSVASTSWFPGTRKIFLPVFAKYFIIPSVLFSSTMSPFSIIMSAFSFTACSASFLAVFLSPWKSPAVSILTMFYFVHPPFKNLSFLPLNDDYQNQLVFLCFLTCLLSSISSLSASGNFLSFSLNFLPW